jgi:uncharacterized membrane protein
MVFLSAAAYLPIHLIFSIGIIIVFGHNMLDSIMLQGVGMENFFWYAVHQRGSILLSSSRLIHFAYPVLPWIGLMFLGYAFGVLYKKGFETDKRKKYLLSIGSISILLFIVLRLLNLYGDMSAWELQDTFTYSLLSFLNTTKYPPSLLFILMTIGPSLIFLCFAENIKGRLSRSLIVIGRVPLFYYVIHIYVIHLLGIIGIIIAGQPWTDMVLTGNSFMTQSLLSYGYNLQIVYLVWIAVVLALYPLCKKYNEYKINNRSKWWLSYL